MTGAAPTDSSGSGSTIRGTALDVCPVKNAISAVTENGPLEPGYFAKRGLVRKSDQCTAARRTCEFRELNLLLRERRAPLLPGEQQPWDVVSHQPHQLRRIPSDKGLVAKDIDPLKCLPLQMPFKSRHLLYYFIQLKNGLAAPPRVKEREVLPFVVQDPDSLRDTLLVAGMHYAWATGDTQTYAPTFLHHKVETIQFVNERLRNVQPLDALILIQHVVTLCLAECGQGHIRIAESHLDGVLTLIDLYYLVDWRNPTPQTTQETHAYRYLILSYHATHAVKGFMQEGGPLTMDLNTGHLKLQSKALSMLPFFFRARSPSEKLYQINGEPIIASLRTLTKLIESPTLLANNVGMNSEWATFKCANAMLNFAVVSSHVGSLFRPEGEDAQQSSPGKSPTTSWCAINIVTGLYMHSVLGLWNAGKPIKPQLLRNLLAILARDLIRVGHERMDAAASDLWFWEQFIGAYAVAWHQSRLYDGMLKPIEDYFLGSLRAWSETAKVTSWEDAQAQLLKVSWSTILPQTMAQLIWIRVIEQGDGSGAFD